MVKNWRKAPPLEVAARSLPGAGGALLFGGGDDLRDTVALRLADVTPNPDQPRRFFDQDELENLAASLRAVGQLAPILVRRRPNEPKRFLLVAGERRWRAAGLAGLPTVAAHILPDDCDVEQVALIENLQRVNLSPVEEAEGVQRLIDRHGYSQEQAGALLGRSRTEVNTTLSLLRLHPSIRGACVTSHPEMPKALLLEIARMPFSEQLTVWPDVRRGAATVRQVRAVRRGETATERGESAVPPASGAAAARGLERLARAVEGGAALLRAGDGFDPTAERDRLYKLRDRLMDCAGVIDALLKDAE